MWKKVAGVLLILAGIAFGLYVGVWLMFVGGIVQIIDTLKAGIEGKEIALGIVRIVFAGGAGGVALYALALPGIALIWSD